MRFSPVPEFGFPERIGFSRPVSFVLHRGKNVGIDLRCRDRDGQAVSAEHPEINISLNTRATEKSNLPRARIYTRLHRFKSLSM